MGKVRVTIGRGGKAVVDAEGYSGTGCRDATELLRQLLGPRQDEAGKPEMYDADQAQVQGAGQ